MNKIIGKLISVFKSIKQSYLNKSPKEKWMFIRNIGIFILRLTGIPILNPNYKVDWYSYAALLVGIDYFTSLAYTIWYFADEPVRSIQAAPLMGVLIPSLMVYSLTMLPSKISRFQSLLFFAGDHIYKDNTESNIQYNRVTDKSAIQLLKGTTKTMILLIGVAGVFIICPLYVFVVEKEIQLPVAIIMPFTTLDTYLGMAMNIGNQLFICLVGISGNIGIEIMNSIIKNTVWACAVTIRHSLDGYSNILNGNKTDRTNLALKYKLRNILIQIQDFDRYILELCDLYYWKFFMQPYMLTVAVAGNIFFYLYSGWLSGVGVAIFCYIQLFILCDIGKEVENAKDLILEKLYEIPWHLMSPRDQLVIAHVMNRLQNGTVIQMGPFSALNYDTFANFTKTIYSLLMMMINRMNA